MIYDNEYKYPYYKKILLISLFIFIFQIRFLFLYRSTYAPFWERHCLRSTYLMSSSLNLYHYIDIFIPSNFFLIYNSSVHYQNLLDGLLLIGLCISRFIYLYLYNIQISIITHYIG